MLQEEIKTLNDMVNGDNYLDTHRKADKILCLAIKKLADRAGCFKEAGELLDAYDKVERYFAVGGPVG
mgnify:CR=1 FL=1